MQNASNLLILQQDRQIDEHFFQTYFLFLKIALRFCEIYKNMNLVFVICIDRFHLCFLKPFWEIAMFGSKITCFRQHNHAYFTNFSKQCPNCGSASGSTALLKPCKTHIIWWFCNKIDKLINAFSKHTFYFWKSHFDFAKYIKMWSWFL